VRHPLVLLAVAGFVAASLLVGRWLSTEGAERGAVLALLRAQARGDVVALLRRLACTDEGCRSQARANARRLRAQGELRVAHYDSGTSHALAATTAPTRVAWLAPGRRPTVQCVLVRREGDPLSGISVTLLRVSAPIALDASCR
jgi:hypothetical protein